MNVLKNKSTRHLLLVLALAALAALAVVPALANGGRPLNAWLSGANEVNGGDPDGSGTAYVTLNQGQGEVCFSLEVEGIALSAIGAHIHTGVAGVNGGVVVPLAPPGADGTASGCRTGVDPDLIKAIRQSPEAYYVNVHSTEFPGGAVRGQLEKPED